MGALERMILETDVISIVYIAAWNRQDLQTQCRLANWRRSAVIGHMVYPTDWPRDPDTADYQDEAAAHGVTVRQLLGGENA